MPLTAQGDTIGLLYFEEREGVEGISGASRLYLELMAENIGLALANLRLREQLTNLAIRDALTGLLNRRSLDGTLNRRRQEGDMSPIAGLMIDIDHFKHFNDEFGHEAGDVVMQQVAAILLDAVGDAGQVHRFGGEEFTVLMPGADEAAAREMGERIRSRTAATPLAYRGRVLGHISVSIGVAAAPIDGPFANLVARADAALLEAKTRGRNLVIAASAVDSLNSVAASAQRRPGRLWEARAWALAPTGRRGLWRVGFRVLQIMRDVARGLAVEGSGQRVAAGLRLQRRCQGRKLVEYISPRLGRSIVVAAEDHHRFRARPVASPGAARGRTQYHRLARSSCARGLCRPFLGRSGCRAGGRRARSCG